MPVPSTSGLHSLLLWILSGILAVAAFTFQNKTGPTYPLKGTVGTGRGTVNYVFLRSEDIGTGLQIMLKDPVPAGLTGEVQWRRYKSADEWTITPMVAGTFRFRRRGDSEEFRGRGAVLPSLAERAGKYEYFVLLDDGGGPRSVTGDQPIYARYKAAVPRTALLPHIVMIFLSMTLALRTGLQALRGGPLKGLLWATIGSLLVGAFVLGPIVQRFAFGVWWSGIPFGYDWTDNKVLVGLTAWIVAAALLGHPRRVRIAVLAATMVTLAIYLIPHSVFGSEYDYSKGSGHGTAGAVAPKTP